MRSCKMITWTWTGLRVRPWPSAFCGRSSAGTQQGTQTSQRSGPERRSKAQGRWRLSRADCKARRDFLKQLLYWHNPYQLQLIWMADNSLANNDAV